VEMILVAMKVALLVLGNKLLAVSFSKFLCYRGP